MKRALLIVMTAGCVLAAAGQGYVNFNFEDAGTNTIDPSAMFLSWNVGAPGWQHAGVSSPFIGHNTVNTSGTASYFLVDSSCSSLTPITGSYSFALINGHLSPGDPNSAFVNTWIAQIGDIPVGTESFDLDATGGPFSVTINNINVPMLSLGGNVFAGDVSAFAGQSLPLRIQNDSTQAGGILLLDNLLFSPSPVPEPGSLALFGSGLGVLIAAALRNRRKSRSSGPH